MNTRDNHTQVTLKKKSIKTLLYPDIATYYHFNRMEYVF